MNTESHLLQPFLPSTARLLMLGSFPPKRERWSMDFYYPNLQNDMWRIYGILFFGNKDFFVDKPNKCFKEQEIREFLTRTGIAIGDTARTVIRHKDNASDKFLEITEKINLTQVLDKIPECHTIVTTGQKATDTLLTIIKAEEPKVGTYSPFVYHNREMRLYRMPSSSRAYPKPLEEKAAVYSVLFRDLNMLP